MYNFRETDTYREALGIKEPAANQDDNLPSNSTLAQTEFQAGKRKSKVEIPVNRFVYARWVGICRQVISFLLLLSVLPYSLLFEIRTFWWNYAAIPASLRQPTWANVESSVSGPLVKFAEQGGARQPGQDLYTANDIVRLLIHWVLVLALILFVYGFFNEVEATPEVLRVRYAGRWRKMRWEQISLIRTMELEIKGAERLVVLVQARGWGLSFIHRCYSLLLGAGWRKGFIITSDIKGFDTLVQYLIEYKTAKLNLSAEQTAQVENPAELFVEDGFVSPAVQGTFEVSELMDAVIDEIPANTTTFPHWPTTTERQELFPKMAVVALIVPALYVVGLLLKWQQVTPLILVGAALLFVAGLVEWAFASYLMYENGRQFAAESRFSHALLGYPYLQGTRIVVGVVAIALTIVFAPGALVFLVMAAAYFWCAVLTMLFTARLFEFNFNRSALAGLGVLLYQLVFLAFYNLIK